MTKLKNTAPCFNIDDKQLKFFDFDEALREYGLNKPDYDFKDRIVDDTLIKTVKKWCFSF